jgi:hypothetical protein
VTRYIPAGDAQHSRERDRGAAQVNVRLMGDPEDLPQAAAAIIAAAAAHGWTASEPSRPYPNHGGPGVRVFFDLTHEEPT